jgi:hypothetical protein
MKASDDPAALKELCEAVSKLTQTLNKLPVFKEDDDEVESIADLTEKLK